MKLGQNFLNCPNNIPIEDNSHQTCDIPDFCSHEEFEDTKGVIIIRKSKDRQHNGQKEKMTKRQTRIYKTNI